MKHASFQYSILIILLVYVISPSYSQNFVADYSVAKEEVLRSIPEEFINKARTELVIAYQHTSHGTHVSRGVFGLPDYKDGDDVLFGVSTTGEAGKLEFRDYALASYAPSGIDASDLSRDEIAFIQTTRNYLDAPENASVNVVMWSWCGIAGHDAEGNYLPGMDSLIAEYGEGGTKIGTGAGQREKPVTFVFMTGHANLNANVGELNPKEQSALITDNCNTHGYFCLDYYTIDTYDMDDNYWEDAGDNGNSLAYGGNYYEDWENSHVLGADYYYNKAEPGGGVSAGSHTTQHITANRKGYAMWWILARIAGWEGYQATIPVTTISVTSAEDVTSMVIGTDLQFSAEVLPVDATDKEIAWSVTNQTGSATITTEGLLSATAPGTVNVVATAQDGSEVAGSKQITITDLVVPVSAIHVSSDGGVTEILTGDSLQFFAGVLPAEASNQTITWSVHDETGSGTITQDGKLTAKTPGTIIIVATAQDGSGIADSMEILIMNQTVLVNSVRVVAEGGIDELPVGSSLQLELYILPLNATNKEVIWRVVGDTGDARITQSGLVVGESEGAVNIIATAIDGSGERDTLRLTIISKAILVDSINVKSFSGATEIEVGGNLQFLSEILPIDATDQTVTWSVENGTGKAEITQGGFLTAIDTGAVTVIAEAMDSSGVKGYSFIIITDQPTEVTESKKINMSIYPNPGKGIFYLKNGETTPDLVRVIGSTGLRIQEIIPEPGTSCVRFDLSNHPPGPYFIKIFTAQTTIVKQVIIVR